MKFNLSEKLSEFKQHFNPQNAFMRTLQGMIPRIIPQIKPAVKAHFDEIQKPEEEGGNLKIGEDVIGYWIGFVDDKMVVSQCGITFDARGAMLSEPHFTIDAEIFLQQFINTQNTPLTDGE